MCKNPMWRIPCPAFVYDSLFSKVKGYNRTNGAFVFPVSDESRYDLIFMKLQQFTPFFYRKATREVVQVGCGKCLECKLKESKQWAQRSVAESLMHDSNWFITLTYDDEHLPPSQLTFSRHSYEFGDWHPLVYEDFEAFKKRLLEYMRYHYQVDGIRFLMCGEYGPKNGRPHFHVIFYNLPLPDVEKIKDVTVGGKSYVYLTSDIINQCWGKGFITIGEVNWDTSAYVGRYVMKKMSNLEEYDYCNLCYQNGWEPLPPEMRQASRRPGLAKPFYDENKDEIYAFDKVVLPNGKTPQPCAYFDRLYDLENPELLSAIKEQRKSKALLYQANEQSKFKNKNYYNEYKNKKYDKLVRKIAKLTRPL